MPLFRHSLLIVGALGALLAAPAAQAGANIAVCWTLSNEFNKCVRQYQYGGYGRDWDDGGWGGRGGYGGYGGDWDGDDWRGRRPPRRGDAAAACQSWLIQMKAAGCF